MTTVFCTSKLKDFLKGELNSENPLASGEQWNANLFLIQGKKCIAFLHKETVYSVVLFNVEQKDISNLKSLFTEACIKQLYSDKILEQSIEPMVRKTIGNISFHSSDRDLSTIASLNDVISRIKFSEEKIDEYVAFDLNATPNAKRLYEFPKDLMQKRITELFKRLHD
ncbi:MAG: hypothetical protein R2850_00990 [Bacteroidia bacterium]